MFRSGHMEPSVNATSRTFATSAKALFANTTQMSLTTPSHVAPAVNRSRDAKASNRNASSALQDGTAQVEVARHTSPIAKLAHLQHPFANTTPTQSATQSAPQSFSRTFPDHCAHAPASTVTPAHIPAPAHHRNTLTRATSPRRAARRKEKKGTFPTRAIASRTRFSLSRQRAGL